MQEKILNFNENYDNKINELIEENKQNNNFREIIGGSKKNKKLKHTNKKTNKKLKNKMTNEEYYAKNYKNIIDYNGYEYVLDKTQKEYNKFTTAYESWLLISNINNYVNQIINNKKTITIIGIGDSPVIFLLIFKKIFDNKNISLRYLPISEMRNMTSEEKKIGIEKFSKIENFIETDHIMWVDYVSTGNSFFNFLDLLSKNIKKKSYFFIYGDDAVYHPRQKELKKINSFFHNININYFFSYFIAATIGNSENYYMRCVNKKKIDKNYKLELFENKDIPLQKNIYGDHCINFSNFLYNLISNYFSNNYPDN